ncbi:MAG TPA: hypothetical protein EYP90_06785, partial [Chromatiaceae bacterium]|nr:hypothetical protein [Chromatiaceae bacterium]
MLSDRSPMTGSDSQRETMGTFSLGSEGSHNLTSVHGLLRSAHLVFPVTLLLTAVVTGCLVTLFGLFSGGLG